MRIKGSQTLDYDVCLQAKIKMNIWATSMAEIINFISNSSYPEYSIIV